MRLLLVRHGLAEDKADFARTGKPDAERPLTREGLAKLRRAAKGLKGLSGEVEFVASSPLVRARQTAEVLAKVWKTKVIEWPELAPEGRYASLLARLEDKRAARPIVLVGHEPHLSRLICWLLTGADRSFVLFKKGGACLLDFPKGVGKRAALLRWVLTPKQLRAVA